MRVALFAAIAVLLAAASGLASSNDAAWRTDIDFLRAEIPRRHVQPFTRVPRAEFEASLDQIRTAVPSLADHQIIVGLLRALAKIGDAHTTMYPAFTQFPIACQWMDDGFYVVRTTDAHRDLLGTRLVAIDDTSASDVLTAVATTISHENEWWMREVAATRMTSAEVLHAAGLIPALETASFRFARADGSPIARTLVRLPPGVLPNVEIDVDKPLHLRNRQANYWYEYLPASGTLYVQYNQCVEIPGKPMAAFGAELAAAARSHTVDRLILDLRHNTGGNSALLAPMLSELYTTAPHLDDPNRFFVVIGPRTFSSALMNAFELDRNTRATLVGLPTGGKPNHFGNVATFTLPRSGILVQVSTRFFQLVADGDPPALMPDIEVPSTAGDYFAGRDAVLDLLVPVFPRRRAVSR